MRSNFVKPQLFQLFAAGLLSLLLAACSTAAGGPAPTPAYRQVELGTPFVMQRGDTVEVKGAGMQVTFNGVENDSRCATDVVCVWAGNATVGLSVAESGKTAGPVTIASEPGKASSKTVGGYVISVHGLSPAPVSSHPMSQEAYRVTLIVTAQK